MKRRQGGFIDPLSLIGLGFLVVTLLVGTVAVNKQNANYDTRSRAKVCMDDCTNDSDCGDNEQCYKPSGGCPVCRLKPKPPAPPAQIPLPPPETETAEDHYQQQTGEGLAPTPTPPPQLSTDYPEEGRYTQQLILPTVSPTASPTATPTSTPTPTPTPIIQPTEESRFVATSATPASQEEGRYTQQFSTPVPAVTQSPASTDFMLGLYYGINPSVSNTQTPYDQEALNFLTQNGINSLIVSAYPGLNENDILKIQSSAEQANLNIFWGVDMLTNYYSPDTNQSNIQINNSLITQLNQSPNLAGFYALDEPTPDKVNSPLYPNTENNIYTQIHELAPDKPVMTVFWPSLEFADYQQLAADFIAGSNTQIVSTDPYYWSISPSEQVFNDVANTNNLINTGQLGSSVEAQYAILSGHSDVSDRSQESFQYQAVSAVTAGANGIFWWDWGTGCTQQNCGGGTPAQSGYSTYFQNISSTANLLQTAMPGLTGQTVATTANSAVSYRVNQATNNQLYVFAISNSGDLSPSIASSQIPNQYPQAPSDDYFLRQQYLGNQPTSLNNLPPNTVFQVVGENRTITTDAYGNLRDTFGIMDSHIYQQILP